MKKQTIGFILALLILGAIGFAGWYYYGDIFPQSNINTTKIIGDQIQKIQYNDSMSSGQTISLDELQNTPTIDETDKNTTENEEDRKTRIELIKKRFALRGTIARGDDFIESNQPLLALTQYLRALKESPNDDKIKLKIAQSYYEMKKFDRTVENYEQVKEKLDEENRAKYLQSLLYSTNLSDKKSILTTAQKIKDIPIDVQEKFYYINSFNCVINFHECKVLFERYFEKNTITFQPLNNIKKATENFKNFQSEELYYKDSLIVGAFYQDKLYSISSVLGIGILKQKPEYQPMLLMVGQGYYEIGKMPEAKAYLEKYYNLNPNDTAICYLLGNIHFRLGDYVSSNLYYNASLKNGFSNNIDLQRKLAYNYYLLGDKRGMLNIFAFIIEEEKATIDDFSLGIYWNIMEKKTLNAISWSEKGLEKFKGKPGYEIFYGYLGWIYREENNLLRARSYIEEGIKINPRNPLLTLNAGYMEMAEEKYQLALVYFKRTKGLNEDGEFGELAQNEIIEIEKYLENTNK